MPPHTHLYSIHQKISLTTLLGFLQLFSKTADSALSNNPIIESRDSDSSFLPSSSSGSLFLWGSPSSHKSVICNWSQYDTCGGWHIGAPKTQSKGEIRRHNAEVINQQAGAPPYTGSAALQTIPCCLAEQQGCKMHGDWQKSRLTYREINSFNQMFTCVAGALLQRMKPADYLTVISKQPLHRCNWSAVDLQPKLVSVTAEIIMQ